jgi:hypothetical protein
VVREKELKGDVKKKEEEFEGAKERLIWVRKCIVESISEEKS